MSAAAERVRAYVDCLNTLYDQTDPMPDRLVIDTSGLWRTPPEHSIDLTYDDLLELLAIAEAQGEPCGQVSALLVGRLSAPCVVRGRHTEHRAENGDTWTESIR